jgi:cell division protein FtsN
VASYARGQDAEVFASKLRSRGYDANVVNAEVAGRTWSRVQIGRLTTQKEARELQRNLRVNEKIEQSFIAISY